MENVSYVGLSAQMALHRLMEVTANNMANMNTPGYKSENVLFKEYLTKDNAEGATMSQVQTFGTYRDMNPGTMTRTSNPLDVAIQGDGYFSIQTPTGVKYTRDGAFSLNSKGELVTQSGYQVMGDGGPLTIPEGATHITITEQGAITTEKGAVGKLKVVAFDNTQKLIPEGENLLRAEGVQEKTPDSIKVAQGMVENSNVQPILEMNKMIEILRMYQATQNMLQTDHERLRGTIQKLTRV